MRVDSVRLGSHSAVVSSINLDQGSHHFLLLGASAHISWSEMDQSEHSIRVTWPPLTNQRPVFRSRDHIVNQRNMSWHEETGLKWQTWLVSASPSLGLNPSVPHRCPVWLYLIKKWYKGVQYGKLSVWHHWTRIKCPWNQTCSVLGVIHKWSLTKPIKQLEMDWFGLVW